MKRNAKILIAGSALIVAATLLAYLPASRAGWIWDDDWYVTQNETLRSAEGLVRIWTEIGAVPQYYPLVHTTFWLEYQLWGLEPLGYHLVNIVLHALNAVLLWLVLRRLKLPGAWLAAAIFAVHPVHVESVAWVTERKNVLSGFFYLCAVLMWFRFSPPEPPPAAAEDAEVCSARRRHHWGLYALTLLFYVFALLSKTVTASLPAAMLLIYWWKRGRLSRCEIYPTIPFFLIGICLSAITVWMEKRHVGATGADWDLSLIERVLIAGRAVWFYAGKLIWPRTLIFMYPRWRIDAAVWWQYLFPLTAASLVVALWLLCRRIGRGPLVGALFFAGTLFPALGFIDVYPMRYSFVADHFQYLASIGVIALIVGAISAHVRTRTRHDRVAAVALCTLILSMLGGLTWSHARAFRDLETLWRDVISKNPASWMAHNNLGSLLAEQGRLEEAREHYEAALRLRPWHANTYNNLGQLMLQRGDYARALTYYRQALEADPKHMAANFGLGRLLVGLGRYEEARPYLERTVRTVPKLPRARRYLARVLIHQEQYEEALEQLRKALELGGEPVRIHKLMAAALRALGKDAEAVRQFDKVLALRPKDTQALMGLALLKATSDDAALLDKERALALAGRACELTNYLDPLLLADLARVQKASGQHELAVRTARRALDRATALGRRELVARIEKQLAQCLRQDREAAPSDDPGGG